MIHRSLTLALASLSLALSGAAQAASTYSFSGSTVNGEPFNRPGSSSPSTQGVRYAAQSFRVTANGTCRILSTQSYDGYVLLYRNGFDPAAPGTHLVTQDDDGDYQYSSEIVDVQVAAGDLYTLVTTGYDNQDSGQFTNLIQCSAGAVSTAGGSCSPTAGTLDTACLNEGRFEARVFRSLNNGSVVNAEVVPQGTEDSAIFWFFNPTKWELFVKVVDGCAVNNRHWVFVAGLSNTAFQLQVEDTQTGQKRFYANTQGQAFASVLDTQAFATCP
jgi:hypothetical protein